MTDRSMKAILLDGEGRAPESRASESGSPESRRLALVRETEEAGAIFSPPHPTPRTLTLGGGRANPGHPSAAVLPLSGPVLGAPSGDHSTPGHTTAVEPVGHRPVLSRPSVAPVAAAPLVAAPVAAAPLVAAPLAAAPVVVAHPAAPPLAAHPRKEGAPLTTPAPRGTRPVPAVRTTVLPGLGAAHPGPIGAAVGLVHGIASHAVRRTGEPELHQVATAARRDPARYGSDLILLGHQPQRYHELEHAGRLPSQVWTEYEGRGRLDERLRAVHEREGAELERLYRHRPIGERAILGLAAASDLHEDIARGLDHLRAHALYPARVGFAHLVRGFTPAEIVRVGAAFLPGATEPPLVTFREIRAAHEERYREQRRNLLRRMREAWAIGSPSLIPMFHALVRDFSAEQAERLRAEIERDGDVESVLEEIEAENREARMAAVEAAFARWQAEWESSRDPSARTPMEEPQMKLPEEAVDAIDLAGGEEPPPGTRSARTLTLNRPGDAPSDVLTPQEPASLDDEDDEEAGAVRGGGARFGGRGFGRRGGGPRFHGSLRPRSWSSVWEILPEEDDDLEDQDDDDDDAGAFFAKAGKPTAKTAEPARGGASPVSSVTGHAAAVQPIRAPSPGAYTADGMVPWRVLTQGFGRRGREELRRAWDGGRVWEGYNEVLARRGEEATTAREAEFCRRLEALGCAVAGPCRVDPECLSMFADMGEMFTPEQWARLRDALTTGVPNPLAVWRAIERENLLEAISIRGPAFLRHFGAWGRSPRWNPIAWELEVPRLSRVVLDGETAGLIDDIGGALGSFVGSANGGAGYGDAMSGIGSTIGSLFGQAGQGGGAQTAGALVDFASRIAGAFAGRGASGQLTGRLGDFARQAVGRLTGRAPAPPPPPPPPPAAPMHAPMHAPVHARGIDLPRVLERWGAPHSRTGAWARRILPALAAIGLPTLAFAPPHELLHLIPHPLPTVNSNPGTWWRGLTSFQGIGPEGAEALRALIENAAPGGAEQVLAAYQEVLRVPLERLKTEREALFAHILRHAQKVAGSAAFDPHRLPGGDPFALFSLGLPREAWRIVEEGIRTGQGIEAFRAFENAREQHLLAAAATELPAMLAALWEKRGGPAGGDAAGTEDDAGWWGRRQRGHDREALFGLDDPRQYSLRGRGEVSRLEQAGEVEWIRPHRRMRPLFHLTFGRPMGRRELARLLALVPQLRAHPDGVIREMAGLVGQARSVLGVDARTGEYLAEAGDTLPFIADKLVGDAGRWRELEAANPAREEGDPRIRIPCNWFGFVPYAIPVERLAGEIERRREEAGASDEAGALWRRAPGGRRSGHRLAAHGGGGNAFAFGASISDDPDGGDGGDDADAWSGRPLSVRERRVAARLGLDRVTQHPGHILRLLHDAARRERGDGGDVAGLGDWWAAHNPFASPPPAAPPTAAPPPPPPEEAPDIDFDKLESPWPASAAVDGPRQPLTKHTYVVKKDDWPERIADKLGGGRPHRLAELFHANPHKQITAGDWTRLVPGEVINLPDAWWAAADASGLDTDAGAPTATRDDDAGDALRQNLTRRTYSTVGQDTMFSIAKKLGAVPNRPHWFAELRDANPHKSMEIDPATHKQIKWTRLSAGEIINIPDEWPNAPQLRPPPGGVPTAAPLPGLKQFPELPGGVTPAVVAPPRTVAAGATVDPGTILRVQGILIAWRHAHPDAARPRDFGAGSPVSLDALGVLNTRTQEALASFQRWSNKTAGTQLRTDGVLDPSTIAALDSWSVQALAQLPRRPAPVAVLGADLPHPADPFASILGTAGRVAADVARRVGVPASPPPRAPARRAPAEEAPPGAPAEDDPFAGVPGVEGDLERTPAREPQDPRDPSPIRPGNAPPPLAQLPDLLQRAGAPGVPSLPGGAPHAPPARPLQVPPEVYRRLREQAPPEAAPSPAPAKKKNDDAVAVAGLGILAALGGLIG